jgi:hypothetical protein
MKRAQGRLATTSYFDGRPDARHIVAVVGTDVVVSIRENLRTYGVTDGEVWAVWRAADRLFEHRFENVDDARRLLGKIVRGEEWPMIWMQIARAEYAVPCPVCEAAFACPCVDGGEPLLASKGRAQVVGAPWRPEPHDVEVKLAPLVHAGRITQHHRALHGESVRRL